MKRVLLSVAGTVVGLVALLSFKSGGHATGAAALPSAALPPTSSAPSQAPPTSPTSAPPNPSAPTTPTPGGGTPTPAPSRAAAATRTIAGQAVQTQYGTVQVQVSVSGTKITNVSFLQLTAVDDRSARINNDAAPILLQETLAAQNAHIDAVSGASYTSQGYMQSLQSALDQAGIS